MFSVVISEIKPFNVPIKNRHRVGGGKPPPYGHDLGKCVKQQFVWLKPMGAKQRKPSPEMYIKKVRGLGNV